MTWQNDECCCEPENAGCGNFTPTNPLGPQGHQGFQGSQGSQGYQGAQGSQGAQGANGIDGAQGNQGAQGLTGPQGYQGFQGNDGAQGFQGNDGAQGFQGTSGSQGAQGFQGPSGGPQGFQGAQGDTGAQGSQGSTGAQGAQGDSGAQGAQGFQGDTPVISGPSDTIAGFDNSGALTNVPGWGFNSSYFGWQQNLTIHPDGDGSLTFNDVFGSVDPIADAPNDNFNMWNYSVSIDPNQTGHPIGTNGTGMRLINGYFSHSGKSNTGTLECLVFGGDIGNNIDPLDIRGHTGMLTFCSFKNNVNISGPIQGFVYQISGESSVTFSDSGTYANIFGDFCNFSGTTISGWNSFTASPTLGGVKNNYNYSGVSINPNITTFNGNAGGVGLGIYGNWGTFGTGGFEAININPTVTSVNYAAGINVNMNNVTATNKYAIDATGDVRINGSLSFTGSLGIGQLNAFYSSNVTNGGGNPQTLQSLTTQINAPANTTTANADTIGVNTAMLMAIEDNAVVTSGPFQLGLTSLALPNVVETHTGSSVDYMSAATFALNLVGSSTGGTIDTVRMCRSVPIPNGITTVNKLYGFFYHAPFGSIATLNWGFYSETSDAQNFFAGAVKIGGTAGSTDRVTNDSVGLEIQDKGVVLARLTTSARDALTAVNGMMIYNTDTNKFQGYAAGSWVDLN